MNDIYLLNERYIDSKYQISRILQESWQSMSPVERQFLKECEDLGRQEAILLEGPFDNLKAKAAGVVTKAGNVGKALTGRGDQVKDPTKAKIDSRVQSFKNNFVKSLEDLSKDFTKMGITDPQSPGLQALSYAQQSAQQLNIEYKPGFGDKAKDLAIAGLKNLNPLSIIKKVEDKYKDAPLVQDVSGKINKVADELIARVPKAKAAIDKLGELYKKHPKLSMIVFGIITASVAMSASGGALAASGVVMLLNTAAKYGADGNFSKALYSSAKAAVIGKTLGGIINLLGDAGIESIFGDANIEADNVISDDVSNYLENNIDAMKEAGWSPTEIAEMRGLKGMQYNFELIPGGSYEFRGYFTPDELENFRSMSTVEKIPLMDEIINDKSTQAARKFFADFIKSAKENAANGTPLTDKGWESLRNVYNNADKFADRVDNFTGKAAAIAQGAISNVNDQIKQNKEATAAVAKNAQSKESN
jgi:hypothetical protein